MTRPLLISDCDEVLLHMVRHFATWLGEAHEIEDILAIARKRDEELAKARETAQYAGEADPYKHPEEDDDDDFDDDDVEVEDWDDDEEA